MTIVSFCSSVQPTQNRHDLVAGGLIEIARRFVGEQYARPGHERAGDGGALHLAAGQLARLVLQPMPEADQLQHLASAVSILTAATPVAENALADHGRSEHIFDAS